MREIKFRAWDAERKRYCVSRDWVEYTHFGDGLMVAKNYRRSPNHGEYQKLIIEQFTGLKDKNGVEIYEGDEVLLGDNPFKNIVVFRRDGFYAESSAFYSLLGEHNFIKVIGNIHENKELLK
jgi:hypothetical protein